MPMILGSEPPIHNSCRYLASRCSLGLQPHRALLARKYSTRDMTLTNKRFLSIA